MIKLKKFFAKIGAWFRSVVKSAEKAIQRLSPELQEAFSVGSRIVNLLNNTFDQSPEEITATLNELFPNLTESDIQKALKQVATGLNIAADIGDSKTLPELITTIQGYLREVRLKDGAMWAKLSSTAAKIIAHFCAPAGTKSSIFELLMETFYQVYVKK